MTLTQELEDQFQELATTASEAASEIDCEPEHYIQGLELIIQALRDDIQAIKETL